MGPKEPHNHQRLKRQWTMEPATVATVPLQQGVDILELVAGRYPLQRERAAESLACQCAAKRAIAPSSAHTGV